MARASGLGLLLLVCACARAARGETDPELLRLGERALCAASHSKIARSPSREKQLRAMQHQPAATSGWGFSAFVVFGVRPCSGALLSDSYIITNAYCTEHATNGTAFLGGHKYQSILDLKLPEVVVALINEIHNYDSGDQYLDHDVAIAKLARSVGPSPTIQFAKLTSLSKEEKYVDGIMMGFGETFEGDFAHELKSARLTLVCGYMCNLEVPSYCLGLNAFCAANTSFSMCWGDMGGPVVDEEGMLVALISYKVPLWVSLRQCSTPARHTFFMSIPYYRDWINSIVSTSES